jgi:hypothetical protein
MKLATRAPPPRTFSRTRQPTLHRRIATDIPRNSRPWMRSGAEARPPDRACLSRRRKHDRERRDVYENEQKPMASGDRTPVPTQVPPPT